MRGQYTKRDTVIIIDIRIARARGDGSPGGFGREKSKSATAACSGHRPAYNFPRIAQHSKRTRSHRPPRTLRAFGATCDPRACPAPGTYRTRRTSSLSTPLRPPAPPTPSGRDQRPRRTAPQRRTGPLFNPGSGALLEQDVGQDAGGADERQPRAAQGQPGRWPQPGSSPRRECARCWHHCRRRCSRPPSKMIPPSPQ
jgi:hypothetical protein